jgi:hypothetical protein
MENSIAPCRSFVSLRPGLGFIQLNPQQPVARHPSMSPQPLGVLAFIVSDSTYVISESTGAAKQENVI